MNIVPYFLDRAFGEIGVTEIPGPACAARIKQYQGYAGLSPSDEIAWCSSAHGFILGLSDIEGTRSPSARSYLTWGVSCGPVLGATVILRRGTPAQNAARVRKGWPEMGHVGFYLDAHHGFVYLLGGNQADRYGISAYKISDVIAYRLPKGFIQ